MPISIIGFLRVPGGVQGEGVFLGNPKGFRLGRLGNLREPFLELKKTGRLQRGLWFEVANPLYRRSCDVFDIAQGDQAATILVTNGNGKTQDP